MFRKVLNIVFYILMTTLFLIWVIDYSNVVLKKDPLFCVEYKKNKYEEGFKNNFKKLNSGVTILGVTKIYE